MKLTVAVLVLAFAPTAAAAHRLGYATPAPPDGRHPAVFTSDADGGRRLALTSRQWTAVAGPTWSPDGKRLVYWGCRAKPAACETGRHDALYLIDANGHGLRRLTTTPADEVSWSPDGKKLALLRLRGYGGSLSILDVPTGTVTRPTHQQVTDAQWSPRGETLLLRIGTGYAGDVWTMDAAGGHRVRYRPYGFNRGIAWSRDGSQIAFVNIARGDRLQVARVGMPRSKAVYEPDGQRYYVFAPNWISDSAIAVLRSNFKSTYQVLLTVDPRTRRTHLIARGVGGTFAWSPDGRRVAYDLAEGDAGSDVTPQFLYVAAGDGSHPERVSSESFCENSAWSSDSRSLLYTCGIDRNTGTLWTSDAAGRHPHRVALAVTAASWQP